MEKPNSRIHVCARVRPIIPEDYKLGTVIRSSPEICVHLKSDGQTIKMTKDVYDIKMFRVDHTFDGVTTQMDVYNASFKKIVVDALGGFNGTGMCYGQTGSGKSHTMFGTGDEPGLVQCAINDVFEDVRLRIERGLVANVFLSFYQLYCEQAYDLLVGPVGGKTDCIALAVREDIVKGAFVENLQYIYVDDEESTMDVLRQGLRNRKVNSTQFNMSSSRSHAIFQMYLDFEETEDSSESTKNASNGTSLSSKDYRSEHADATKKFSVRRRILTFVDLAGSERVQAHHQSKSKAQFKEAVTINKSISALGNCIQALANNSAEQEQGFAESYNYQSKRNLHIPFRDCKLTRLLAEPLGGNSKTCIIVNIGPCTYNFEETKSTLKFAKRAMSVKKSVKKSEIEQLQVQDVHTEEAPEEEPSPVRPGLGTKKTSSVKVSRIVVRESPEERMRRNTDFGTDYTFNENNARSRSNDFGDASESHNGSFTLSNIESVRNQLYNTNGAASSPRSSSSGGYVLHLPVGTEFDTLGKVTVSGENGAQQASVRLNLSDFLKACQAKSTVFNPSASSTNTNGNTVFNTTNGHHQQENATESHMENQFKLSLPDDTLALETDLTPIAALSSKSNFASFFNSSTPAKDLSLDWASTPASVGANTSTGTGKPPLSPGLSRLMNPKTNGSVSAQEEPTPQQPPPQHILLPSPHPNLENIPTLRLSDSERSDNVSLPSSPEKHFAEVVTQRTQRKFVWERGSGEPYASTIEVTPMLNRHRGRIADVAAIAPVSVNNFFKTYAEEPTSEIKRSKSAPPRSPMAKKVTTYLKHTPSADLDVSLRSSNSTPGTDDKKSKSPAHAVQSARRPSLSVVTVRDETNSLPRSFAPQPTPSPKYTSPSRKSSEKVKEVGPYTFHKTNPSPPKREIRLDTKKRNAAKPASKLAATIKPFGKDGLPIAADKTHDDLPLDLEGRLNAVSQMDENGNRPHSVLISLVHQLRDELQKKEEEITSLKSFILNN